MRNSVLLGMMVAVWAEGQPAFDRPVSILLADSARVPVLYAVESTYATAGFYKSKDGGASWTGVYLTEAGTVQPPVSTLVMDPTNETTLYAGTALEQGGVWRTRDGGATWERANAGLPAANGTVERLFLIPATPRVLYAKVGNFVYETTDGGDSWVQKATLPGKCTGRTFVVNLGTPSTMYCAPDHDAQGQGGRVFRSADGGENWVMGPLVEALAPDFSTSNTPYGFSSLVTPAQQPLTVFFVSVNSYSACTANGETVLRWADTVFRSTDGGASYTAILSGVAGALAMHPAYAETVMLYKTGPMNCMVKAGAPTFATAWPYYRSNNNGQSFWTSEMPRGPSAGFSANALGPDMAFWAPDPGVIYAACYFSGVCKSQDGGTTWSRLTGTVRYTLAKPAQPLVFTLGVGEKTTYEVPLEFLEDRNWRAAVTVTASGGAWLSLGAVGQTPAALRLTANATGLGVGNYEASIRVASSDAGGDLILPVKLTVTAASQSKAPRYVLTRFAGTGDAKSAGDGGPADQASLNDPRGMCLDGNGNLYIAEYKGHRVRRVTPSGVITTVVGTGVEGGAGDGGPATAAQLSGPVSVAFDGAGNMYIGEYGGDRVRKVTPQGTVSTLVHLVTASSVLPDQDGSVWVTTILDLNKVSPTGGVSKLTGSGALGFPRDVAQDPAGNLIVSDSKNYIWKVTKNGVLSKIAGTGVSGYGGDGPAATALMNSPEGVAVDPAGNIYIADTFNSRVRMIDGENNMLAIAGDGSFTTRGEGGPALAASIQGPWDVIVDRSGNLYVAVRYSNRVVKLTKQLDVQPSIVSGPVNGASLDAPVAPGSVAVIDGSNLAQEARADGAPWPAALGGTSVTVNGVAAPMYAATAGRLVFQIPYETGLGTATAEVKRGQLSATAQFEVVEAAPGIQVLENNRALALLEDGSISGPDNPAPAGGILLVRFTGLGATDTPVRTGEATPQDALPRPVLPASVTIGGEPCEDIYIGLMPGEVGMAMAYVKVPMLESGEYEVVVTVGGKASKAALVSVKKQ
ncbi:MAG: hypothetical protein HY821_03050 [Acidobacteria bacterium]|nr:hypothetical protein [Acidobacteriota bacterium]